MPSIFGTIHAYGTAIAIAQPLPQYNSCHQILARSMHTARALHYATCAPTYKSCQVILACLMLLHGPFQCFFHASFEDENEIHFQF